MSNQHQKFHVFQDSVEDPSWATISISDECGDLSLPGAAHEPFNNDECDDTSLDDTLPIEAAEELNGLGSGYAQSMKMHLQYFHPVRAVSSFPVESPLPPQDMKGFQPVHCSSSIQLDSAGSSTGSLDFSPEVCSSRLDNQHIKPSSFATHHEEFLSQNGYQKTSHNVQPAPIIQEIMKTNPSLRFPVGARMNSDEFKPQRCSTGISESQLKVQRSSAALGPTETSTSFVPLRCSTGLDPPIPSVPSDFKPNRCSTGLQENSVAFLPLRCSTGLNESAAFNPPMSSTAQNVEDSNISDFKNLRMCSEEAFK